MAGRKDYKKKEADEWSLKKRILSDENIYNAIFSIDSYIMNPSLLSKKDLERYHALHDRFNRSMIRRYISNCKARLTHILHDKDALFDVGVYFRLKKYDKNKEEIVYRPIHTAPLLDQICMVCLLQPLMFEDSKGRDKTDLANRIPANFYGYVPSVSVDRIFEKWQHKYSQYNQQIAHRSKRYRESHEYRAEVSLDIQNFFPSINPAYIVEYASHVLSGSFAEKDHATLRTVLAKLVYIRQSCRNLDGWEREYYGDYVPTGDFRMARGVAQGLPQSYFFGNLCMVKISDLLNKKEYFQGDSIYYVDDSVIYLKSYYPQPVLEERIKTFNEDLIKEFNPHLDFKDTVSIPIDSLDEIYRTFHSRIDYKVEFHADEKSRITHIDDTAWKLWGLPREASSAGMYMLLDEVDQNIAIGKLLALEAYVSNYLSILGATEEKRKEILSQLGIDIDEENLGRFVGDHSEADRKILHRYKKLFLYNLQKLKLENQGQIGKKYIRSFRSEFKIGLKHFNGDAKADWFDTDDGSRFQAKSRLLIRKLPLEDAREICRYVTDTEKTLSGKSESESGWLYQQRDAAGTLRMKSLSTDRYAWLRNTMRLNFSDCLETGIKHRKQLLLKFVGAIDTIVSDRKNAKVSLRFSTIFDPCMIFALRNSEEMKRQALNAFFSFISGFEVSDKLAIVKTNSKPVDYSEFRILAMLRNPGFIFKEFEHFLNDLEEESLENRMVIDYGLVGVLPVIINKVSDMLWVDKVILTHRITKSFWQNGSKFLNSYTLHNEEHAVTLIRKSVDLVSKIDWLDIKRIDWLILFISCYLHDISMVLHPNLYKINSDGNPAAKKMILDKMLGISSGWTAEMSRKSRINDGNPRDDDRINIYKDTGNFLREVFEEIFSIFESCIRSAHPKESARFIIERKDNVFNYLDPVFLHTVAEVGESHGQDIQEVYGLKSKAKGDSISEKYMKMLIRLADLQDVANDRINYYLLRQNVEHMTEISKFHWISHLVTDSIRLEPEYEVKFEKIERDGRIYLNQYIDEILVFRLKMNVRCLAPIPMQSGKGCQGVKHVVKEYNRAEGQGGITVHIGDGCCGLKNCPTLCRWVMRKHEWLLKELKALQDFLNSVNQPMFRTKIRLDIRFENELKLDKDLYDSVINYLTSHD